MAHPIIPKLSLVSVWSPPHPHFKLVAHQNIWHKYYCLVWKPEYLTQNSEFLYIFWHIRQYDTSGSAFPPINNLPLLTNCPSKKQHSPFSHSPNKSLSVIYLYHRKVRPLMAPVGILVGAPIKSNPLSFQIRRGSFILLWKHWLLSHHFQNRK